jgi:hypothetical protein
MKAKKTQVASQKIHFAFELGFGWTSYLISRFGFSSHGFSHVRPLLDDGSSIDSYEDAISPPRNAEDWPGDYPWVIPPGVQHRPEKFRELKARTVVMVPVTSYQKEAWLKFLWKGVHDKLPYDHAAIEGFTLGGAHHVKDAYICSAWARQSGTHIGLGYHSEVPSYEVSPDMLYAIVQEAWGGKVVSCSTDFGKS